MMEKIVGVRYIKDDILVKIIYNIIGIFYYPGGGYAMGRGFFRPISSAAR